MSEKTLPDQTGPSLSKSKSGQNTAEYLVLLILVTVMSIGVFTVFGKTLRGQISNVVSAMSGDVATYTDVKGNATEAKNRADREVNMGSFNKDEITYGNQ